MSERTALYRPYAADGTLLYIGVAKNFGSRWQDHARKKPWWPEAEHLTVDWYPDRDSALAAETAAIHAEKPLHNIMHNGPRPARVTPPPRAPRPPRPAPAPAPEPIPPLITRGELLALSATRKACESGVARAIRVAVQLTQAEIADICGVSPKTVALWEVGQRVPSGKPALVYAEMMARLSLEPAARVLAGVAALMLVGSKLPPLDDDLEAA